MALNRDVTPLTDRFLEARTDEEIMGSVAQGNLGALRILFDRHHMHVFNFLNKMSGDRMLAEDLTQEVFYKLLKYRTSYNQGRFVSWLFTIARNSLASHYSKKAEQFLDVDQMAHKLADEVVEEEDYTQLHRALQRLEVADRELLVLQKFQGLSYKELAGIMDMNEGTIKTRVSRALNKLRTIYFEIESDGR